MCNSEPNIPDNAKFLMKEAAEVLAIDRHTLLRAIKAGMILYDSSKRTGRKTFLGKELKRYWREWY